MEKVKTSISIDKDVYEFIQQLAESERANVSHIVNKTFFQMMKEKGKE